MFDDVRIVAYKAESALLELADLEQNGPLLRITHRFWKPHTLCLPGEEVCSVSFVRHGREFRLPLSLAQRLLLNYLAETRHIPQSATQIAAGIRRSTFYVKHGANSGLLFYRRIVRTAVKVYIQRLRESLGIVFREGGLDLDSTRVLVSTPTTGNEVQYQLRATIQWTHVPG